MEDYWTAEDEKFSKEIILKKVETYKDLLNEIKEEDHE